MHISSLINRDMRGHVHKILRAYIISYDITPNEIATLSIPSILYAEILSWMLHVNHFDTR